MIYAWPFTWSWIFRSFDNAHTAKLIVVSVNGSGVIQIDESSKDTLDTNNIIYW